MVDGIKAHWCICIWTCTGNMTRDLSGTASESYPMVISTSLFWKIRTRNWWSLELKIRFCSDKFFNPPNFCVLTKALIRSTHYGIARCKWLCTPKQPALTTSCFVAALMNCDLTFEFQRLRLFTSKHQTKISSVEIKLKNINVLLNEMIKLIYFGFIIINASVQKNFPASFSHLFMDRSNVAFFLFDLYL